MCWIGLTAWSVNKAAYQRRGHAAMLSGALRLRQQDGNVTQTGHSVS